MGYNHDIWSKQTPLSEQETATILLELSEIAIKDLAKQVKEKDKELKKKDQEIAELKALLRRYL